MRAICTPGQMCTRVLFCSTELAPPGKVEQIRTQMQICTQVHFHKTPLHDQNTPHVQIYTTDVYLHRVQIVHINEALDSIYHMTKTLLK